MDLYNCLSIVYIISDLQDNKLALDILNSLELEKGVALHSSSIYHMLFSFLKEKKYPSISPKKIQHIKAVLNGFSHF